MREKPLTEKEKKNIIREYIFKNTEDIEKGINGIYEFIESYTYRFKDKKTEKKLREKIAVLKKENCRKNERINNRDKIITKLKEEITELKNDGKKMLELETNNKKLKRENAELLLKLKNNGESKDIKEIVDGLRHV